MRQACNQSHQGQSREQDPRGPPLTELTMGASDMEGRGSPPVWTDMAVTTRTRTRRAEKTTRSAGLSGPATLCAGCGLASGGHINPQPPDTGSDEIIKLMVSWSTPSSLSPALAACPDKHPVLQQASRPRPQHPQPGGTWAARGGGRGGWGGGGHV